MFAENKFQVKLIDNLLKVAIIWFHKKAEMRIEIERISNFCIMNILNQTWS